MTSTTTTYNGWTNYETWAFKLWIDNEEHTYTTWQNGAQRVWNMRDSRPDYFTESEYARFTLADALKEWAEASAPDLGASVWADLLNAALSEVNWSEIADNMLAETEGYTSAE